MGKIFDGLSDESDLEQAFRMDQFEFVAAAERVDPPEDLSPPAVSKPPSQSKLANLMDRIRSRPVDPVTAYDASAARRPARLERVTAFPKAAPTPWGPAIWPNQPDAVSKSA